MRSQTILAVTAGLILTGPAAVVAQDAAAVPSCIAAMNTLMSEVPQPTDPALVSFANSYAWANAGVAMTATDPCAAATAIPPALTGAARSYEAQLLSFASAHASELSSVQSACAAALASGGAVPPGVDPQVLSSEIQMLTGYGGTTCLPASSGSGTGSPNAAVAKPTGVVAGAAAAAAGLLGAAAML
ncbi:hypothetical protein F4820DRAFT_452208 [Hypoxylon rubiginosum]|uniref:Uncharacterized protein n=1 Tax=Hypoxylon rubiginosum TaxID=110542 RepID=A0ACB9YPQ9_9PEZI|nr:hypothetical protein F4820DRAFT_452208 [Hypoxylon rubiginosum]